MILIESVKEILPSRWSNGGFYIGEEIRNILHTDIVVNIEEILKGERSDKFATARIDKGEDENTISASDGYPDFLRREKVLLFLSIDDSNVAIDEDYYMLTGMSYGKYNLDENLGKHINDEYNFEITELKERIIKEMSENPNYKKEKAARQEEIRKKNIELFVK